MEKTQKFLNAMYGQELPLTIRFLEEPRPADRKGKSQSFYSTIPEQQKHIEFAENSNLGVFFMPNRSNNDKTNDIDVQESFSVFIDIDDEVLPSFFPLEPSAVVSREDGKGHHVYWFIEKTDDLERWKGAQHTLINFYKSDKVIKNPSRLMRLPGTTNKKHSPRLKYEVKKQNENRHNLDDIILAHQDQKHLRKIARIRVKNLFKEGPVHDGEGRHKKMVEAAFILNDYGIVDNEYMTEMSKINEKYLADPYTETELKALKNVPKYAKGETGAKAVDDAMREAEKHERITELLKNWYYVYKSDLFVDIGNPETDITRTTKGFNFEFSNLTECVNAAGYIGRYSLMKKAEQFTYEPGKGQIIQEGKQTFVNMWKKPTLEAQKGKPGWFLDHINYLFKEEDAKHFLAYLAHMIQHPRKKIMHAILIISPHTGTGKSILVTLFRQLFGGNNVVTPHNENITDKYTGWARHCQLCFIHEIMQGDRKEFLNKIKPFITEETIEIREMYQPPYEIKNYMHIIASSNYRLPILLDKNDRRWAVLNSEVEAKEDSYYKKLIGNIEENAGQVLEFLMSYDLKDFDPGQRPALNSAKQELIEQSISDLEMWIKEEIENENPPFDRPILNIRELFEKIPDQHKSRYTTENRLKMILKDCGAIPLESRVTVDKKKKRYWCIRDQEIWINRDTPEELRVHLDGWQKEDDSQTFGGRDYN